MLNLARAASEERAAYEKWGQKATLDAPLRFGDKVIGTLGVAETRLESVGFGKEKPKVTGHDEQSWLENRRCEFKQL